jgi:hypothetical protein
MSARDACTVPGWPVAFRGSTAVAAGLVTPGELRGRRFAGKPTRIPEPRAIGALTITAA